MEQYSIYTDYLSRTVYEEFISIMAGEIRKIIAREIAQTKFYTLVLDEAKDVSGYEQLCLCVRYCSGSVPAERLMGLIRLSEGLFDACAIVREAKVLIQLLSGFGCTLVGLAADGASVMSGKLARVQALLKEEHPWLIHVHCAAHRLNLVLVKALKNLCPAMINIVDKLHSLFNSAKTNDSFEAEQKTLKIRVLKIPLRSETRWSSMFHVLDAICSRFKPIMLTLMKRAGDDDNAALTAGGLYHKMACGEFIINCVVLRKALATIHSLSEYLQGASIEWHHVAHDIRACKSMISQFGNEMSVAEMLEQAEEISTDCCIPLNVTSPVNMTRNSTEHVDYLSHIQSFSTKVCHKVLAELELRFPDTGMELLKGLDGLNSTSQKYLKRKTLSKLIAHYGDVLDVNETLLNAELAKYHMFANSGSGIVTMDPAFYPNLMKLFNLKRSLPVSSAEAERSFSTMKRVKTPQRNRLDDTRLSDLCLLASEKELTKALNMNSIIDIFNLTERRVPL